MVASVLLEITWDLNFCGGGGGLAERSQIPLSFQLGGGG